MGAGAGGFGASLGKGKENKKPLPNEYRKHPEPELATAFRREAPTSFREARRPENKRQAFTVREPDLLDGDFANVNAKFGMMPKNTQVCKKHRTTPIEFYNEISAEFVCRLCAKSGAFNDQFTPVA